MRVIAMIGAVALSGVHQPSFAQVIPPSVLPGVGPGARRVMVAGDRPPWRGVVLAWEELRITALVFRKTKFESHYAVGVMNGDLRQADNCSARRQ